MIYEGMIHEEWEIQREMCKILYLHKTYNIYFLNLQISRQELHMPYMWFRCMVVQNMGLIFFSLLILFLVTGERSKISFKHGWISHRAGSSIFWTHLVIFTIASAVAEHQWLGTEHTVEPSSEISDNQEFLHELFLRFCPVIDFSFCQKFIGTSCSFGICSSVVMIEILILQIQGCLTNL